MIKVRLTEDKAWKGETYLAGDRMIPEELAIALGIEPDPEPVNPEPVNAPVDEPVAEPVAEPKSATVADLTEEVDEVKTKRRKGGVSGSS